MESNLTGLTGYKNTKKRVQVKDRFKYLGLTLQISSTT
jgi:hypothetical protein